MGGSGQGDGSADRQGRHRSSGSARGSMDGAWVYYWPLFRREELEIEEMHCFIHPENQVSIHLAEKLGFEMLSDADPKQEELVHFRKSLE